MKQILVLGSARAWVDWVDQMSKLEDPNLKYSKTKGQFITSSSTYHFISTSISSSYIIDRLMGRVFHDWIPLIDCKLEEESLSYVKSRMRLRNK